MAKQSTQPPPFCKNCVHFMEPYSTPGSERINDVPRCQKYQMTDLVMGEQFYIPCSDVRSPNAPCGTSGKLFQRKPFDIKIEEPASN